MVQSLIDTEMFRLSRRMWFDSTALRVKKTFVEKTEDFLFADVCVFEGV